MNDQTRNASPLLDDLEELQQVLGDTLGNVEIPVLEDIIKPSPNNIANSTDAWPSGSEDDHSREIFLQELIDDMLPDIEAELRRRLLKLDSELLERWYQQSRRS